MSAGDYVAAAYLIVFAVVLVYVVIIATKLARLERDVSDLTERARRKQAEHVEERETARVG